MWRPEHVWGAPSGALSSSLSDAILKWWYAHNLFGLWLTPMLLALTYYIVPRVTNTPLYSYTLSLISFWGMAFFYIGVGDHHILQSPTPAWLKTIAEVSSWMLLVPVFAFTINILGTMKGNWDRFFTNLPLRFTMTAFFFYFLVNIQGAFEAIQPFNKLTHFTNFVVAHAHLALLGAFTILGMGVIDYIVAQVFAKPLYSRSLSEWQYWLVTVGFTGFFSVLTLAGFQQGFSWQEGIPEVNVLPQLHAYYIARGIFGAMIVLSGIVQIVNIGMTIFTNTTERRCRRKRTPGAICSRRTAVTCAIRATRAHKMCAKASTSSTRRSLRRVISGVPTSRPTCSGPSAPAPTSHRSRAGIRTTGSPRTSTTRATWIRGR